MHFLKRQFSALTPSVQCTLYTQLIHMHTIYVYTHTHIQIHKNISQKQLSARLMSIAQKNKDGNRQKQQSLLIIDNIKSITDRPTDQVSNIVRSHQQAESSRHLYIIALKNSHFHKRNYRALQIDRQVNHWTTNPNTKSQPFTSINSRENVITFFKTDSRTK